jgi:16S rRNA (uracil1498-N3)-methyltransferase
VLLSRLPRQVARDLRHDNQRLIIRGVARRIHVSQLSPGLLPLEAREAHHARDVLRLPEGSIVEVFDDAGLTAPATLTYRDGRDAAVRVDAVRPAPPSTLNLVIASAIPKGSRADWMVEKLSELGVDAFVPLATARAVVLPEGQQKLARWQRISAEAAKQSRRPGVMRIEPLTTLDNLARQASQAGAAGWYCSTTAPALPIAEAAERLQSDKSKANLTIAIGPEGGWTDVEIELLNQSQFTAIKLTPSVLRVETAAIAAAAMIGCCKIPLTWNGDPATRNRNPGPRLGSSPA